MAIRRRVSGPVLVMLFASGITLTGAVLTSVAAQDLTHETPNSKEEIIETRINVEGAAITATLDNSDASMDFISLLR